MKDKLNLANSLLIATPSIDEDSLFYSSLVYIGRYNNEGTMGLIVNKPSDIKVSELLKTIDVTDGPGYAVLGRQSVYIGGPVNTSRPYILYEEILASKDESGEKESRIRVSNSEKMLVDLANGIGPSRYLIMLGCSMWGNSQLETELSENCWITMPSVASVVFDTQPEERALLAARHIGFNLNMMHA